MAIFATGIARFEVGKVLAIYWSTCLFLRLSGEEFSAIPANPNVSIQETVP